MKHFLSTCVFILFCTAFAFSQNKTFQLSTHILDITEGKPAPNVTVVLEKLQNDQWIKIAEKQTSNDGRIGDFLAIDPAKADANEGTYRLTFYTKPYFASKSIKSFYPFVEVSFELSGDSHYHVPITLSPYGYSTYRGS